ncbi:hypothetical protein ACQY0O_003387 [Thecaphora frezii]
MADLNQSVTDNVTNTTGAVLEEAPVSQNPGNTGDEAFKVFAGNLAFATTEDELKTVFSEAGTVTQAQIITRGTRSLGYGFVTFSSEAEAQKAVQILDKKEVGGRQISVESAKPQAPHVEGEGKKGTKAKKSEKKPRSGARAARRPRTDDGEEGGAENEESSAKEGDGVANGANGAGQSKSARRRQKKKAAVAAAKANGETTEGEAEANGASGEAKPKATKPKRQPKGAPTGEPSQTLVFVANLAFETTDETLAAAFEKSFKIKSAHVVKRKVGNRSKGFGFVDFADHAEQTRAVETMQNVEIDGRAISLKVAVQSDRSKPEAAEGEAEAVAKPEATQA